MATDIRAIIKEAQRRRTSQNIQPFSESEYEQQKCDLLNAETVEVQDGFPCEYCGNKGVRYKLDSNGILCSEPCPECDSIRKSIKFYNNSGLKNLTFDSFNAKTEWQKRLLTAAKEFTASNGNEWLFIGGQSGSGKTHICSAIIHDLIFNHHTQAVVFHWVETSGRLKRLVNDISYGYEMKVYKETAILYIDDFLKSKNIESLSAADVKQCFELINYRYNHGLRTIISSEYSIDEVIDFDEATGGRIKQMAGRFAFDIRRDQAKNYRLLD